MENPHIQSMEDMDRLLATKEPVRPKSHNKHVILTFIFPPAGLYFAWKAGTLDFVLPKFVISYSALFFIMSLPMFGAPMTFRALNHDAAKLAIPIYTAIVILLAVCIVGVVVGFLHLKQVKKNIPITKADKAFLIILVTGIVVYNTVLSIYITTLTASVIYSQVGDITY